jgi:hypothetical protein
MLAVKLTRAPAPPDFDRSSAPKLPVLVCGRSRVLARGRRNAPTNEEWTRGRREFASAMMLPSTINATNARGPRSSGGRVRWRSSRTRAVGSCTPDSRFGTVHFRFPLRGPHAEGSRHFVAYSRRSRVGGGRPSALREVADLHRDDSSLLAGSPRFSLVGGLEGPSAACV